MPDSPLCPLCGTESEPHHIHAWGFTWSCPGCRLCFVHPLPGAEALRSYYGSGYHDSWGTPEQAEEVLRQKQATFAPHLARLQAAGAGGRLLDVGCARGEFLDLARREGFAVHGLEISPHAAHQAAQRLGREQVTCGTLESFDRADGSFEVITLFDCLEHLPDPDAALAEAARLLTPGGWLYGVTPDTASLSFRLMDKQWWHMKAEHLCYFDAANLSLLLTRHGFTPLEHGANRKTLSLEYLFNQLQAYPVTGLTPLARLGRWVLPAALRRWHVTLPSGEFWLLARKGG